MSDMQQKGTYEETIAKKALSIAVALDQEGTQSDQSR